MILPLTLSLLSPAWAQTSRPTDYLVFNPVIQKVECGGATLTFRRGEERVTLNGRDLAISWTDDSADGLFSDGKIAEGHHLQIMADGAVLLNDEPCRDVAAP